MGCSEIQGFFEIIIGEIITIFPYKYSLQVIYRMLAAPPFFENAQVSAYDDRAQS